MDFWAYKLCHSRQGGHKAEKTVFLHESEYGYLPFFLRNFMQGRKPDDYISECNIFFIISGYCLVVKPFAFILRISISLHLIQNE